MAKKKAKTLSEVYDGTGKLSRRGAKKPEMTRKVFIGIDPGKSGGVAFIDQFTDEITLGSFNCNDVEMAWLFEQVMPIHEECFCVIEQVHAMPGQGVTSMFTFGTYYGLARGILAAYDIPKQYATPRTWQKCLNIRGKKKGETTTAWKKFLIANAMDLFPSVQGITKATADALLIAEYARRTYCGNA